MQENTAPSEKIQLKHHESVKQSHVRPIDEAGRFVCQSPLKSRPVSSNALHRENTVVNLDPKTQERHETLKKTSSLKLTPEMLADFHRSPCCSEKNVASQARISPPLSSNSPSPVSVRTLFDNPSAKSKSSKF